MSITYKERRMIAQADLEEFVVHQMIYPEATFDEWYRTYKAAR